MAPSHLAALETAGMLDMFGFIERLLDGLNHKPNRVFEETATDEEKYGPEVAGRFNEWIEVVDSYGVVIYLKDGTQTSQVVCVLDCELNETKESPSITVQFGICRASEPDDARIADFTIQDSVNLRDEDILRFFRCDQPNDARELEQLKQQAEEADKRLSDRLVHGNRSGVDAAPYSFFWVSLPVRAEVSVDVETRSHSS